MCMMLKTGIKARFTFVPNILLILQQITLIHRRLYFELMAKII